MHDVLDSSIVSLIALDVREFFKYTFKMSDTNFLEYV